MGPSLTTLVRRAALGAGIAVVVVAIFLAGVVVGGHPRATGISDLPPRLRDVVLGSDGDPPASEVLGILEDGYYTPVDPKKLERASVDAMLKTLDDPYTFYLDPDQYAQLQRNTQGIFYGVGLSVRAEPGGVTVASVYPDSPARRAGMRAGDVIVEVDGRDVRKSPLDDVVRAIRGPKGTDVRVGYRRAGVPGVQRVRLTRAEIKLPLVIARMITSGGRRVGYVRLLEFDRGAGSELRKSVDRLEGDGAEAFVFDLRGDPGGLVDEAVAVSGVFLPKGSPVVTTQGLHRARTTLRTSSSPATTLPLAVLVDRNSASASEIVSGALRDERRATLVGTRTFGKALVQTTRPLRNGGALRFTSARYRTPAGLDINHRGLMPSVTAADDPRTPGDEALPVAVRVAARGR